MDKQTPKLPIFIGCADPEIIKGIDSHITMTESYNCELVVIQPSIQQKLAEGYQLSLMETDHKNALLARRESEHERARALESAMQLKNVLFDPVDGFNRADVKAALNRRGSKVSNSQVIELMEFISLHDFIQPIDLSQKSHERKYVFTFSPKDLMNATAKMQKEINNSINLLKEQNDQLEQNRLAYEVEYLKANNLVKTGDDYVSKEVFESVFEEAVAEVAESNLTEAEVVEDKPKKRGRPKKVYPADPEEHDSDCKCGTHKKGKTQTEKYLDESNEG